MKLCDMTVTQFVDTVASDAPAPGGGSVAALAGSIGAALTAMVGNLTQGRKKYDQYADFAAEVETKGNELKAADQELKDFVQRREVAFREVRNTEMRVLMEEVHTAINTVADQSGSDLVLDSGAISPQAAIGVGTRVFPYMKKDIDLTPEVRGMLNAQQITVGHAKVLLQLKDATQQTAAAQRVARNTMTVRQTEQLVRDLLTPAPPVAKPEPQLPEAYARVCSQLSQDFGTKVNISMKGKSSGVIEIPYAGREDLVRILQIFGISESL